MSKVKVDLLDPKPDSLKEKSYLTKQIQTSIAILESTENDVVLESLLFLSKYADLNQTNLQNLQLHGLLPKLLKLLKRNICILRLSVRLLSILLNVEDSVFELDQEKYDEDILAISEMFISHEDSFIREFCMAILSKIANSGRVLVLIFKIDLLTPIFDIIRTSDNQPYVLSTFKLLFILLEAPGVLSQLPDLPNFDPAVLIKYLDHSNMELVNIVLEIFRKITFFNIEALQQMLKNAKLVENMLRLLMNPESKNIHIKVISILENCMKSEETSSYFVESVEFLDLCQWAKTCDEEYLLPCINIFEKLTEIVALRQTLYDLSVEDCILYFLRSKDKYILNQTCRAIINMSTHRYCCERMVTPVVVKELIQMLQRKDADEDVQNEVALKTIFILTRRNLKTLDMLHSYCGLEVFLDYLTKGTAVLSEESFMHVLEILNISVLHPVYQQTIISTKFFTEIIKNFGSPSENVALLCLEIMINCVPLTQFRVFFLNLDGPAIIMQTLKNTQVVQLFKNILVFIHNMLAYKTMINVFLNKKILLLFKNLPKSLRENSPLIDRIRDLVYNTCLPIKFHETNRLELTDVFDEKFYLINGPWTDKFPFLEILEMQQMSTIQTLYVVDYTYYVPATKDIEFSAKCSSFFYMELNTLDSSNTLNLESLIHYGKLSSDPFLPKYIYHILRHFSEEAICLSHKIQLLAEYVDSLLCGDKEEYTIPQKIHSFKLHLTCLKNKLGTNMVPIGYLRIGFHCERALLFKAIADKVGIPTSLVKGKSKIYWNEVALIKKENEESIEGNLERYVVDLMFNVGCMMPLGSREANTYCNIE